MKHKKKMASNQTIGLDKRNTLGVITKASQLTIKNEKIDKNPKTNHKK